jgi:hypothetical protein
MEAMMSRKDMIELGIFEAETSGELDAVAVDYSDLLVFGEGDV